MRTRKTLNKALLRKVALKLRRLRHEEHYDQSECIGQTSCGTAACIAGHTVLLAGWRPFYSHRDNGKTSTCRKGVHRTSITDLARRLLGLSERAAQSLFAPWPTEDGGWADLSPEHASRWDEAWHHVSDERPSRIAADLLDAIADGKVKL